MNEADKGPFPPAETIFTGEIPEAGEHELLIGELHSRTPSEQQILDLMEHLKPIQDIDNTTYTADELKMLADQVMSGKTSITDFPIIWGLNKIVEARVQLNLLHKTPGLTIARAKVAPPLTKEELTKIVGNLNEIKDGNTVKYTETNIIETVGYVLDSRMSLGAVTRECGLRKLCTGVMSKNISI